VVITGVIMAEILQGAKTEKELEDLKESLITLPFLKEGLYIWEKTARLSFNLRKKGVNIPISDCLIATLSLEENLPIFTLDEHFKEMPQVKIYRSEIL
jgi:predicted nucleic acid-binding protein